MKRKKDTIPRGIHISLTFIASGIILLALFIPTIARMPISANAWLLPAIVLGAVLFAIGLFGTIVEAIKQANREINNTD